MYCGGGHLEFPIGIKKQTLCRGPSNDHSWEVWFQLSMHWMVLYKLKVFCSDKKFKMAATAVLSLTLDNMGKMFPNASSLAAILNFQSE
jgi:S-formylglutathione hydrolase FrmB